MYVTTLEIICCSGTTVQKKEKYNHNSHFLPHFWLGGSRITACDKQTKIGVGYKNIIVCKINKNSANYVVHNFQQ